MTDRTGMPKPYRELAGQMRKWSLDFLESEVHCHGATAYLETIVDMGFEMNTEEHVPAILHDLLKITRRRRYSIKQALNQINQPYVRKRMAGRTILRDNDELLRTYPQLVVAGNAGDQSTHEYFIDLFSTQYKRLVMLEKLLQEEEP